MIKRGRKREGGKRTRERDKETMEEGQNNKKGQSTTEKQRDAGETGRQKGKREKGGQKKRDKQIKDRETTETKVSVQLIQRYERCKRVIKR